MSDAQVAIAVVEHAGRFLVGVRPPGGPLAGYHEFPGGKINPAETPALAAARECWEETGLKVTIGAAYPDVVHHYAHGTIHLHFMAAWPVDPAKPPKPPFAWIEAAELAQCRFPPANAGLVAWLLAGNRLPPCGEPA